MPALYSHLGKGFLCGRHQIVLPQSCPAVQYPLMRGAYPKLDCRCGYDLLWHTLLNLQYQLGMCVLCVCVCVCCVHVCVLCACGC